MLESSAAKTEPAADCIREKSPKRLHKQGKNHQQIRENEEMIEEDRELEGGTQTDTTFTGFKWS